MEKEINAGDFHTRDKVDSLSGSHYGFGINIPIWSVEQHACACYARTILTVWKFRKRRYFVWSNVIGIGDKLCFYYRTGQKKADVLVRSPVDSYSLVDSIDDKRENVCTHAWNKIRVSEKREERRKTRVQLIVASFVIDNFVMTIRNT